MFFISRRFVFTSVLISFVSVAQANQALNAPGKTNTIGPVSSDSTVHGSSYNPAANSLLVGEGKRVRYGHLSNISLYGEVGKSENMDVKIDKLIDDIDVAKDLSSEEKGKEYKRIADEANNILLPELEKGASLRAGAAVNLPATPFLIKSNTLRGTVSVNAAANLQFSADLVTSPFAVSTTFKNAGNKFASVAIDSDKVSCEDLNAIDDAINNWDNLSKTDDDLDDLLDVIEGTLKDSKQSTEAVDVVREEKNKLGSTNDIQAESTITTDSAAEVRAALVSHFALGYGTSLTDWFAIDDKYGQLEGGVTFNYYNARIGRQLVSIQEQIDEGDDDFGDRITDDLLDNTRTSSNIGVDVGVLWHRDNYQLGATIYNLNEPKFKLPEGKDYLLTPNDEAVYNALVNQGKLSASSSTKLSRHAVVDGSYFLLNKRLALSGYYTLGKASNFVGNEYQHTGASAEFRFRNWFVPSVRAGINKNLVGTKLTTLHAGLGLFGVFNLDAAVSTDSSKIDDTSVPRYVAVSLGFEQRF